MGYSARRGFSSGSMKATGAQRQAAVQQQIAQMQEAMNAAQTEVENRSFTASVGGGVVMNAGAYGGQIADVLDFVEVLTPFGVVRMRGTELVFSYRSCRGLPRGIITKAGFALTGGTREDIEARMRELSAKRKGSQPSGRTFGSTFAKAGDVSAGELIDRAGLKGLRIGGARISEKHANFILTDGGTAADVRSLIDTVKLKVYARFGVKLEEEVRYIGEF